MRKTDGQNIAGEERSTGAEISYQDRDFSHARFYYASRNAATNAG